MSRYKNSRRGALSTNWFARFSTPSFLGKRLPSELRLAKQRPDEKNSRHRFYRAIIGLLFSTVGILQVAPLSIGNDPLNFSAGRKWLAALVALFFSL